jgi:putative MATE family efflux protein
MNERHQAHAKRVALLTTGSITKGIFSMALPIIMANSLNVIMELANAFFLGKVGSNALAAVTMSFAVIFFIMTFGIGLGIGTVAMVSRAYGARDFSRAEHIGTQSLMLGMAAAVAIGTFGFLFAPHMLSVMGARGEILEMGTIYLKLVFSGLIFMFFMFQSNSVFQGAGQMMTPMKIGAVTTVLNIALDPILIFGLLGLPKMGVAGAGTATLVARIIGSILMARVLLRGRHAVRLRLDELKPDFTVMKKILLVGLPGGIQLMIRSSSMLVMTGLAAALGPMVVAALGVGNRLFGIFLLPGFGFGAASSTLVGQNLGAKNPRRAEKSVLMTVLYYLIFITLGAIPLFIFSRQVAAVFNPEPEFVALASDFIRYIAVGAFFLSPGMMFTQALQGAGATMLPLVATAITLYGVQIPVAYVLSARLNAGAHGIWISTVAAGMVNAVLMSAIFFWGAWKKKRL